MADDTKEKKKRKASTARISHGSRAARSVAALVARLISAREKVAKLEQQVEELKVALGGNGTRPSLPGMPLVFTPQVPEHQSATAISDGAPQQDEEGRWI